MTIDTVSHRVVGDLGQHRPWTAAEHADFLDGWSWQRLGYPKPAERTTPHFEAGVDAAKNARRAG